MTKIKRGYENVIVLKTLLFKLIFMGIITINKKLCYLYYELNSYEP
jgi:hypothetical protein